MHFKTTGQLTTNLGVHAVYIVNGWYSKKVRTMALKKSKVKQTILVRTGRKKFQIQWRDEILSELMISEDKFN